MSTEPMEQRDASPCRHSAEGRPCIRKQPRKQQYIPFIALLGETTSTFDHFPLLQLSGTSLHRGHRRPAPGTFMRQSLLSLTSVVEIYDVCMNSDDTCLKRLVLTNICDVVCLKK